MKDTNSIALLIALARIERCLEAAPADENNDLRGYIEDALAFASEAIDKCLPPDHLDSVGIFTEATA